MNYIIIGTSYNLINDELKKITDNSNVIYFDMDDNTTKELIEEAGYVSLFSEEKTIIVKNSPYFYEKSDEKETDMMYEYLSNANPMVKMVFILAKAMNKTKKITKLAQEKCKVIELKSLPSYELPKIVKSKLNEVNIKIYDKEAKLIVERCIGDYDILMNELEKVKIYFKDKDITESELDLILSRTSENDIFDFVNAFIKKDFKKSIKYYEELKLYNTEPVVLIGALASKYRSLYIVKKMLEDKYSISEMESRLHIKEFAVKCTIEDSYAYRYDELKALIKKLAELDVQIKTGDIDKYRGLELFILEVE